MHYPYRMKTHLTAHSILRYFQSPKVGPQRRVGRNRRRSSHPLPATTTTTSHNPPDNFKPGAKVVCISVTGPHSGQEGHLIKRTGFEGNWVVKWTSDGSRTEFSAAKLKVISNRELVSMSLSYSMCMCMCLCAYMCVYMWLCV